MESSNCLPKENEVNVEGQPRNVEFNLGLTVEREVQKRLSSQKSAEKSTPSESVRGNLNEIDSKGSNKEDGLADRYWDDSIERVTNQLKDKLGVKAGCCEKAVCRSNGCWLGPLNGENGFTKLENHVWAHDRQEIQSPGSESENVNEYPNRNKKSSKCGQAIGSTSSQTSLESVQGYDKSTTVSETQYDVRKAIKNSEENCTVSPALGCGPLSCSYVSLDNSTSVAVVKPKPQVHVANLVISPPSPTPSSSSIPTATSVCTYQNIECDADEIHYVAYESEHQMPDIMRLIQKDLSEPYSIYTYRYFIHNWPKLCFLAMDGEKCVGAIVCKLDLHKNIVRRGYIAMLAVDENYRKRKIGSNLVLKAIQAMVIDDADEVVLETEISNKPALRLYENLGFVRDKRLFRYYLNGVDALRLKLWLR